MSTAPADPAEAGLLNMILAGQTWRPRRGSSKNCPCVLVVVSVFAGVASCWILGMVWAAMSMLKSAWWVCLL